MSSRQQDLRGLEKTSTEKNQLGPTDAYWDVTLPAKLRLRGKSPTMYLVSQDQIERLTAGGDSRPLTLFSLTGGIAATLFIQLEVGVVDKGIRTLLWSIFYPMVVLTIYFAIAAVRDYRETIRRNRGVIEELTSVQTTTPSVPTR